MVFGTVALIGIRFLLRLGRWWDERHKKVPALSRFGFAFAVLACCGILYTGRFLFSGVFRITGDTWLFLSIALWTMVFGGLVWFIFLFGNWLADVINEARQVKKGSIDGQLGPRTAPLPATGGALTAAKHGRAS